VPPYLAAYNQPLNAIGVQSGFNLVTNRLTSLYSTGTVDVGGTITTSAGNGQLTALSPGVQALNINSGMSGGSLLGRNIAIGSQFSGVGGGAVNFNGDLGLNGNTLINAPNGDVTINNGATVTHSGTVKIASPGSIPSGFSPTSGVTLTSGSVTTPKPSAGAIYIETPTLNVSGSISAAAKH
jgi:hypothetical protein